MPPPPPPDADEATRKSADTRLAALERFASGLAWAFKQGPEGRTSAKLDLPEDLAWVFDTAVGLLARSQDLHGRFRAMKMRLTELQGLALDGDPESKAEPATTEVAP